MEPIVVVKLGGSAITDKSKTCMPRLYAIHRAIDQISAYHNQLVLLHGGGSFAHPFATKNLLRSSFKTRSQLERVSEIELNLDQLTRIIGVALLLRGRAFVALKPMSFLTLENGNIHSSFLSPLLNSLRRNIIPVIHGDLVTDVGKGFGVLSADRIASFLAEKLNISRVLFGCDVDGVFDRSRHPKLIDEVTRKNHDYVINILAPSSSDATGGMLGKVVEAVRLAKLGVESYIFNLNKSNNLSRLLSGDSQIGTRFVPWNRAASKFG